VVVTFVVDTSASVVSTFEIGNGSKIKFPYSAGSVCDPRTSSYGPGTWDAPCARATAPVRITARTWVDRHTGKVASEFQPALRFVPGLRNPVTLYLKNSTYKPSDAIWYCAAGGCVDEALADPTLRTSYDSKSQWVYRVIKHFSGYTVIAN
jgi:hypothetical protein